MKEQTNQLIEVPTTLPTTPRYDGNSLPTISNLEIKEPNQPLHMPTVYFANIGGRPKERDKYEWNESYLKIVNTYNGIKNLLKSDKFDLNSQAFWALSFPHVTTIGVWEKADGVDRRESNLSLRLFRTPDLEQEVDMHKEGKGISMCGLEIIASYIETMIWYNSKSVTDYYNKLRGTLPDLSLQEPNKLQRYTNAFLKMQEQ